MTRSVRVVIATDVLEIYGGAERITHEIAETFPEAPVYALIVRPWVAARMGITDRVHGLMPPRRRLLDGFRLTAPVLPLLVDRAKLPEADVLVTSSWAFAHRFRTENRAPQICYCHSPLRFAWTMTDSYSSRWARGPVSAAAFRGFAALMRRSDRRASARVTEYLTQSPFVAEQIERFYGRSARVIGAPVDCDTFAPEPGAEPGDHYLFAGRLVEPHKRAGVTIEAFRGLPHRLLVAGDGPDRARLEAAAPANVEFLGHLEDEELAEVMWRSRAVIFPSPDPFGLVPLEAMACGRPVLAYAESGARHTVEPGVTGAFFEGDDAASIARAVAEFDPDDYDPAAIREHALRWDRRAFRRRLLSEVEQLAAHG